MAVSVVDANSTRPDEKIPPLHRDMPPLPRLKGKTMIKPIIPKDLAGILIKLPDDQIVIDKINELCDAVNEQQKQIDKMSCAILDLATPNGENKALESIKLDRTRKALDKGMEHITGLNNMIESWLNLINSDLDQETKLCILKSAISAYVENKGGNNEK